MKKRNQFYDSLEDSSRRIGQSIVLCKGAPAWISAVQGLNTKQQALVNFLPFPLNGAAPQEVVPLTPEYFEIRQLPPLGYVDYGEYSFYLTRKPIRNGKQGFDSRNTIIPAAGGVKTPSFQNLLVRKELCHMFLEKYDSFNKVFDKILSAEEPLKRAFSRTMALSIDDLELVSLWNRGIKVGVANNPRRHGPLFKLPQKYMYLREELSENGIKIEA